MSKKVVCISCQEGLYGNEHLMKDCGLVPYYFHKIYGYDVTIVTAKLDNYTYLDTYLNGVKMEFVNDDTEEEKYNYLMSHGKDIDLLILISLNFLNYEMAKAYKRLNPNGKVLLQLDMNSKFAEWVFDNNPELVNLNKYCDVIATSCRAEQRQLNKKLPWHVELLINGYYDGFFTEEEPDYDKKENIILSVARNGIEDKATDILMEAYALAADKIDWTLHLVGSIYEPFKEFINEYYIRYPHLKDRVIFEGEERDKQKLMNWYKRAKVFALTSIKEGGSPNVIGEALRNGCVMAVTKIDAYEDITYNSKCGLACEINDVQQLSEILIKLCTDSDIKAMSKLSYENALNNYDYRKSIRAIHTLLFGGEK